MGSMVITKYDAIKQGDVSIGRARKLLNELIIAHASTCPEFKNFSEKYEENFAVMAEVMQSMLKGKKISILGCRRVERA